MKDPSCEIRYTKRFKEYTERRTLARQDGNMKVANKVVVVTGAGSGIGRELVLLLLSKKALVAGVDLNRGSLDETANLAMNIEGRFAGFVANVADISAVSGLPEKVLEHFGRVDGVINNAGIIQPFVKLNDLDYTTIERVFNVNFYGTLYLTKAFLPILLKRPEAHLTNLSSMGGFVSVPGQTIYCAAKAAVKLMSEGLASELAHTNVRVTIVFPGAIATNIRQNSGVGNPEGSANGKRPQALSAADAAQIIVRGIEDDAHYVFVGRDASMMDKFYRLSPSRATRAIAARMRELLTD